MEEKEYIKNIKEKFRKWNRYKYNKRLFKFL